MFWKLVFLCSSVISLVLGFMYLAAFLGTVNYVLVYVSLFSIAIGLVVVIAHYEPHLFKDRQYDTHDKQRKVEDVIAEYQKYVEKGREGKNKQAA